jgi:hypothetical protein
LRLGLRAVPGQYHVADPMQPVLDRPLPPQQPTQPGSVRPLAAQAGHRVGDLGRPRPTGQIGHLPVDHQHLLGMGKADPLGRGRNTDRAPLNPAVTTLNSHPRRGKTPAQGAE